MNAAFALGCAQKSGPNKRTETSLKRWSWYTFKGTLERFVCGENAIRPQTDPTPKRTSQVTYVTMVPRVGNEILRPLGVAIGNAVRVTLVRSIHIYKKTPVGRRLPMTSLQARPQYKGCRENTSSTSSSEACVRSMAHSLGDTVSRSPLGEPWLQT